MTTCLHCGASERFLYYDASLRGFYCNACGEFSTDKALKLMKEAKAQGAKRVVCVHCGWNDTGFKAGIGYVCMKCGCVTRGDEPGREEAKTLLPWIGNVPQPLREIVLETKRNENDALTLDDFYQIQNPIGD